MSMVQLRPYVDSVLRAVRYFTTSTQASLRISIPPAPHHDTEALKDKPSRMLKHLFKANHINNALYYNNLLFHNHVPYSLGSAYAMGCNAEHLEKFYNSECKTLEPHKPSPSEITDRDWRERLGDKRYYRAYIDFFEDELALEYAYDWKLLVREYMFSGEEPMINNVIGGLGHPLIHLAYAYEFNSREIAIEALAMAATSYTQLHKYLDDPAYTKPSSYSSTSPLEILHRIREDERLNGVEPAGPGDLQSLLDKHEELLLDHWNAWTIEDPVKQFQASQEAAVSVVVHTVASGKNPYDFFLLHLLTTSHAVRVLIPLIPGHFHIPLVRQWWLLVISTYIGQMRPKIEKFHFEKPGKDWDYIAERAINAKWAMDSHYVKALRAIKDAASLWDDESGWYLASAIKFAEGFDHWTGWHAARE